MKRVITIFLSIVLLGYITYLIYNIIIFKNVFNNAGIVTIGKEININVNEYDIRDYRFFENNLELSKWNEKERKKFINFMKKNKLILKAGSYKIFQGTKCEKAKIIFNFE